MYRGFSRHDELKPILGVPKIGSLYHISWARKRGMVWRCISIYEDRGVVIMQTPKTKKKLQRPVKFTDLRMTRSAQLKSGL